MSRYWQVDGKHIHLAYGHLKPVSKCGENEKIDTFLPATQVVKSLKKGPSLQMSMEALNSSFFVLGFGKDKNSDFCAITLHFVSNVIKWVRVDRK